LYTTLGMPLFALPDVELQRACFAVYNDWLAQFCSHSPRRLIGSALIALHDVNDAVAELERCRKQGLRAAMISAAAPDERPYSSRDYDPFWQAAAELQMPLSLHIITARGQSAGVITADIAARAQPGTLGMTYLSRYMFYPADIQVSLFTIVMGGVLERFPQLQIVSAESDIGWLPHFIFRLDHGYDKFSGVKMTRLRMKPSDYLKRQMFATFQDDPVGASAYRFFGADNYMWASDFPHSDSTWPHSREVIAKDFAQVPEDVTRKIVFENASRLYHIG
jgi:predicted TIM-barrel fold metal-dependent hydrolase